MTCPADSTKQLRRMGLSQLRQRRRRKYTRAEKRDAPHKRRGQYFCRRILCAFGLLGLPSSVKMLVRSCPLLMSTTMDARQKSAPALAARPKLADRKPSTDPARRGAGGRVCGAPREYKTAPHSTASGECAEMACCRKLALVRHRSRRRSSRGRIGGAGAVKGAAGDCRGAEPSTRTSS